MYGVFKPLTKESILQYVSEWNIFKYYIPSLQDPNVSFRSELRTEDNASCRVTKLSGRYRYKDFGETGSSKDCFDYVQHKFGINYNEALKLIVTDFKLTGFIDTTSSTYHEISPVIRDSGRENNARKKPTIINIVERNWQLLDKMYWSDQYGITQSYLKEADIKPITEFTVISDKFPHGNTMRSTLHSYSMDYYEHQGAFRRKIYQPYSNSLKWLSNINNTVVQGIKLLPKQGGEVLFITSSFKDAGAITCNTGIYAIATNNETSFLPDSVFQKLRSKWRYIILWFDNDYHKEDNPGLKFSLKISQEYNLPYVLTPDGYQKDPSDFVHTFGRSSFIDLVKRLLRQKDINYGIYDYNRYRSKV